MGIIFRELAVHIELSNRKSVVGYLEANKRFAKMVAGRLESFFAFEGSSQLIMSLLALKLQSLKPVYERVYLQMIKNVELKKFRKHSWLVLNQLVKNELLTHAQLTQLLMHLQQTRNLFSRFFISKSDPEQ